MAQYVTKIRTENGDLPIDYNSLANLPKADATLTKSESFADAKATGDKIKKVSDDVDALSDAIDDEKTRAEGVESGLATRLQTVEYAVGETGSVAAAIENAVSEAKAYTDAEIDKVSFESLGITATAEELNVMDGITATTTELNYIDGATSNIQNQLNNIQTQLNEHEHDYLPISGGTLAGVTMAASTEVSTNGIRNIHAGTTEYESGVTALATGDIYIQYE